MFRANSKAIGAGIGAAVAVVVVWILAMFNVQAEEEVQGAFTTILDYAILIGIPAIVTWFAPANKPKE